MTLGKEVRPRFPRTQTFSYLCTLRPNHTRGTTIVC
jgi:hypothetical protein